jgi:hypothetical protein
MYTRTHEFSAHFALLIYEQISSNNKEYLLISLQCFRLCILHDMCLGAVVDLPVFLLLCKLHGQRLEADASATHIATAKLISPLRRKTDDRKSSHTILR